MTGPSHQAFAKGFGDGAADGVDVQLGVDAADVVVHGVQAQIQTNGDFLFRQPVSKQSEDFAFPVGEV